MINERSFISANRKSLSPDKQMKIMFNEVSPENPFCKDPYPDAN